MPARAPDPDGALPSPEFAGGLYRGDWRRLAWCGLLALLLHQPLMASSLFGWLRLFFREDVADVEPPPDQDALFSVELDDGLFDRSPQATGANGASNAAHPAGASDDGLLLLDAGAPLPPDSADDDELSFDDDDDDPADAGASDAGAPDAAADPVDAGAPLPDAGPTESPVGADAGPADAVDGGAEPLADAGPEPDAGAPIAANDPPDAGPLSPPLPTSSAVAASADAGPELPAAGPDIYDLPPLDAGRPPPLGPAVKDPNALAGGAQAIRSQHPNVRIYIAADVLRKHQLAGMFGGLLTAVPEWNELLGGTGVDPIRDFDHVLVTGPQMRNPRWIIATMDYNIPTERMHAAVDQVVQRSAPDGKWLPADAHPVPVAVIGKGGYRRVALVDKHRLLVVLPDSAEKQIDKLAKAKPFQKSNGVGIVLYIKYPANALRGFPMPKSVKWMRLSLRFDDGDGFVVNIDAQDKTPEDAAKTARLVQDELEALRGVPLSGFITSKKYFFGKPSFKVDGSMIRASAPLTKDQVERVMGLVEGWLKMRTEAARKPG